MMPEATDAAHTMRVMQEGEPGLERVRRGALLTYVSAVALTSIAYIATFQNASVLAPQITGTPATGGLPSSSAVAGTALAALLLSSLMAARGRRVGIVTGLAVAIAGAAVTFAAALGASFLLLIVGALFIGFGNAAINLSRYAAADLFPAHRRAGAVGLVVWGSTVGAVAGPNLAAPANAIGEALGLPRFAGGFAMAVAFLVISLAIASLGPRAPEAHHADPDAAQPRHLAPMREMLAALFATTRGRTAVAALVSGQLVMVLIMTMTPYHLNHAGHGDATIGLVISAHTFGMFALSPISGRLTERFGGTNLIMTGFGVLALAGVLGAAAPASGGAVLMLPLFLLGFGWNMTFVAGSSLLASGEAYADRARLQGAVDAFTWGTAALAGISAGFVVQLAGYGVLCIAGAVLAVLLATGIALDGRVARSARA
jgi:MFS family permease